MGRALAADMMVRVSGLKAKPELNGQVGRLLKVVEGKGRWQKRLDSGKAVEIKPENLEPLSEGDNEIEMWMQDEVTAPEVIFGSRRCGMSS